MLFSNERIAELINEQFEPIWVSVRPVPLVHIDFGNGRILTRTLNGNIATHVCTAEGHVLDVLPGIYEPETYAERLMDLVRLHQWLEQTPAEAAEQLREYHRAQATALARGEVPPKVVVERIDVSKNRVIEQPLKLALGKEKTAVQSQPPTKAKAPASAADSMPGTQRLMAALVEDTRINESLRRESIHKHLADVGLVEPRDITRWLYREVLQADLDDPYLGLGDLLAVASP